MDEKLQKNKRNRQQPNATNEAEAKAEKKLPLAFKKICTRTRTTSATLALAKRLCKVTTTTVEKIEQ